MRSFRPRSRALYAQGTYELGALDSSLEGWVLTAGVRRTKDDIAEGLTAVVTVRLPDNSRRLR